MIDHHTSQLCHKNIAAIYGKDKKTEKANMDFLWYTLSPSIATLSQRDVAPNHYQRICISCRGNYGLI